MKLVYRISRILDQIDQPFQQAGCALVSLLLLTGVSIGQDLAGEEILYPGGEFAKLDTFEGVNLEDADKLFGKKDYKGDQVTISGPL